MRRGIEELLLAGRWRRDEYAWRVWQGIEPLFPTSYPNQWSMEMAGWVTRTYQRAHRGSKALVHFGPTVGWQDTWWPFMRPPRNAYVIVQAHLWLPPGTHSGREVLWIDSWDGRSAPGDTAKRAKRHQRRMEKENRRRGEAPGDPVSLS